MSDEQVKTTALPHVTLNAVHDLIQEDERLRDKEIHIMVQLPGLPHPLPVVAGYAASMKHDVTGAEREAVVFRVDEDMLGRLASEQMDQLTAAFNGDEDSKH